MNLSTTWSEEVTAFTRAFAGAAVFGIPLVFTMEMWWIGKTLPILHVILILGGGFLLNLGLARVAGFRDDRSFPVAFDEAIDAMAVGIIGALALLLCLNQVRPNDGLGPAAGMVMLLSLPLSLGASVARQVFSGRVSRSGEDTSDLSVTQGVLADIGATVIGGIFIGLSITPTDEVKMIAAGLSLWHVYALIGVSLLLTYIIVFASGFDEASPEGPFQHPFTETILAYTLSLVVALALLLVFERIERDDPLHEIVRQTVVLGVPVAIGGAGGRLVI